MGIGFIADAVELQIGVAKPGFSGLTAELGAFREFDAVCRGLDAVIPYLAGVTNGIEKVGRKGRFTARELHGKLATGLDGNGVIEESLDVFPGELMNETRLGWRP